MKNHLLLTVFSAAFIFTSSAQAQYTGPSAAPAASVEAILKNPVDDQEVLLKGHLLRQIGPKKYIFSDGTAEIVAEIKPKRFEGLPKIDEKTNVELLGEVDTSLYRAPELEVDSLRVIQ
ncbi:YgiW/YdeI family stress tolerance OB fold protein [Paenalcaligenes hominis]|uniref:YgiW/YdeI family stress tolerance OB fold protein n=1 Tax=Paenalcaligenes hominis TaxID=643674 RepID=UPI00352448FB